MECHKQKRLLIRVIKVKVEVFQETMSKIFLLMDIEIFTTILMVRREQFKTLK